MKQALRTIYFNFGRIDGFPLIFLCLFCLLCGSIFVKTAAAQNYPKEIRGYKVQKTKVSVKTQNGPVDAGEDRQVFVSVGEPSVRDISLTGVTLELPAEISAADQSGTVDFLTFKDFRVNDLAVDVGEYKNSFSFRKNEPTRLPEPIEIFVGIGQSIRGALGELRDSKEEWDVTGTIFVFGKFKKFGFSFKRVVPVEINLKIKNPLKNKPGEK